MVGGLADWFAVTALFRHPLGLPIPHTAIIPRKKDQIGRALAGFVQQNFLNGPVVAERLQAAEIPRRAGEWLGDPAHASRLADDIGSGIGGVGSVLRDDELRAAIVGYRRPAPARRPRVAPGAGPGHRRRVRLRPASGRSDRGAARVMRFLEENRAVLRERLDQESPDWVPAWVDERVFNRAFAGDAGLSCRRHRRRTITRCGRQFDRPAARLRQRAADRPRAAARVEQAKNELLDRPDVHDWFAAMWTQLKASVLAELGRSRARSCSAALLRPIAAARPGAVH